MNTISLKHSNQKGNRPSGLVLGEVAINIPDRKIYIGDGTNVIDLLPEASPNNIGLMSVADKIKLDAMNVDHVVNAEHANVADKLSKTVNIEICDGCTSNVVPFNGNEDVKLTIHSIDGTKIINKINVDTTGNASTATRLAAPRKITLDGFYQGETTFDGSGDGVISLSPMRGVYDGNNPLQIDDTTLEAGRYFIKELSGVDNFPYYDGCDSLCPDFIGYLEVCRIPSGRDPIDYVYTQQTFHIADSTNTTLHRIIDPSSGGWGPWGISATDIMDLPSVKRRERLKNVTQSETDDFTLTHLGDGVVILYGEINVPVNTKDIVTTTTIQLPPNFDSTVSQQWDIKPNQSLVSGFIITNIQYEYTQLTFSIVKLQYTNHDSIELPIIVRGVGLWDTNSNSQ